MATSPIYGWLEPDNTDLVKNGALAIRTLGNAIDTTMGTMTPKSTYTAKGSIAAATAASTPANLSVGANGQTIVADSTAATGLKYSDAAPAGGLSRIGSVTNLTGAATITISGISNKSRLFINVTQASSANADSFFSLRFNSDTGAVYGYSGVFNNGGTIASAYSTNATAIPLAKQGTNAADTCSAIMNVVGTFSGGIVQFNLGSQAAGLTVESYNWSGFYFASAQITSVSVISSSGNFDAGTIDIWGA
jgi:hypothetical protein